MKAKLEAARALPDEADRLHHRVLLRELRELLRAERGELRAGQGHLWGQRQCTPRLPLVSM